MVEINNQRKAFLELAAGGTDTGRQKTRNHGYDVIVGELFTDYSDHLGKLAYAKLQNSNQQKRRTLPASFLLVGCPPSSLAERLLSESQDAVALQQIKYAALYLWLIVVISVRQSTVAAISGASLPGAGYGQFEHKADSLIAKFKEVANGQRLMYEQSHHDYLRSGYLHHRLPVTGC